MVRKPVVANYFYPSSPLTLSSLLEELIEFSEEKILAKGIVVPHAGYIYSGKVAGKVYGKIELPEVAVILGPNHTGMGEEVSLYNGSAFLTPLGEAKIHQVLANLILEYSDLVELDNLAHQREHSLEVQIPFLQFLNPKIEIVPICIKELSLKEIQELGKALAEAIYDFSEKEDQKVLIVASSDFSHYEPQRIANWKDELAISAILEMTEEKLMQRVLENKISMCGVFPVAVMLKACKELGAQLAFLVDYKTSGDLTGDYSSVVGYGGIIIY